MMQTLFLSDLHLGENTPEIHSYFKKFIHYCQDNHQHINSIYILGDFFEFWIGDDYQSEFTQAIFNSLALLSGKLSIKCYFMHGNRDFLIAKGSQASFIEQTGFSLINDPHTIELDGKKILLSHGDSLCTDDIEYQKMRFMLRSDLWQTDILAKSIAERIQFASSLREQSKQKYNDGENEVIANVNTEAVNTLLESNQSLTLIHGHTHRQNTHQFTLNGQQAQRIVLAAWYKQGSFLKYENECFTHVDL